MEIKNSVINRLRNFLNHIIYKINYHAESVENPYVVFGIFGIITYPIYFLIWKYINPQGYENIYLRLGSVILCIPLIFKNYWSTKYVKFLPIYWYLTLLYCLPFTFTFLVLKNNFSLPWTMNGLSVLVLSILLIDLIAFSFIFPVGLILGWFAYYYTNGIIRLPSDFSSIVISYVSVVVVGCIFSRSKQILQREKLQAMRSLGAIMAHELRTPLRTVDLCIKSIKKYLPSLIAVYEKAIGAQLIAPTISEFHYEALVTACDDAESETKSAFTVIDMLITKINHLDAISVKLALCSINQCVDEALRRYPFDLKEAELIDWKNGDDFIFKGDEMLMVHILFNLLKNALFYIKKSRKG